MDQMNTTPPPANPPPQSTPPTTAPPSMPKDSMPKNKEGGAGSIVAIVVIVVLLVLGGVYYLMMGGALPASNTSEVLPTMEDVQNSSDSEVQATLTQSPSDELADIDADVQATNLSGVDSALNEAGAAAAGQ